jgi:hypothetical protein
MQVYVSVLQFDSLRLLLMSDTYETDRLFNDAALTPQGTYRGT